MLRKLHAVALLFVLVAGIFGFNRDLPAPTSPAAASADSLLSMLPKSDFVAYGDARQAINVVMPAILAQHPEWQAKVDRDFADFQRDTGVDPRSFDSIAVGVLYDRNEKRQDMNFVAIARGSFNAAAAIDAGFAAEAKKTNSHRERREVEYAGHTIYVSARTNSATKSTASDDRPFAAMVIDTNTVAVGDLPALRSVVDAANGKDRVDDELVALATRTPGALGGFAGQFPGSVPSLIFGGTGAGGDTEIGKAISSIKTVYGSVSSSGLDFDTHVTLRTDNSDQAHSIGSMINALKLFAKVGDSNGQRNMQNLLHDLNVSVEGNEVDLTLHASAKDLMVMVN
jgi:hypothetical protein